MASQTQLILIGFLLASPLSLGPGPAQEIVILEGERKNPVGEEEETIQEGKTNPTSGSFQGTG